MTATEICSQAMYTPEERAKRYRELMYCLQSYNDMRIHVLLYAPHPGYMLDYATGEMIQLPYDEKTQSYLDKVKKMEGEFVKFNFPEFYNADYYETENQG